MDFFSPGLPHDDAKKIKTSHLGVLFVRRKYLLTTPAHVEGEVSGACQLYTLRAEAPAAGFGDAQGNAGSSRSWRGGGRAGRRLLPASEMARGRNTDGH